MATFYKKLQLLRGILSGQATHTGPLYVSVDVTRRCNLQCLFCPVHSPVKNKPGPKQRAVNDMPFAQFDTLCDELKTMGTRLIILEGEGEPLLHKHILGFVTAIKSRGMDAMLLTNGVMLDETVIRSLVDAPLDYLKVSLWASSMEEYQETHPKDGAENFNKIVTSLSLLGSIKAEKESSAPFVELYHLLTRRNLQSLDALARLAHETRSNGLWFSPLHDIGGNFSEFAFTPGDHGVLFSKLRHLKKQWEPLSIQHNIDYTLQRYRIGEAVWKKMPCYIGWYHARIRVDGTVLPCFWYDRPMGDLNQSSFSAIWNGPAYRKFRKTVSTREGLARVSRQYDCRFCSHAINNRRIHNIVRWFPTTAFKSLRAQ